jgi:hypothetical protein
MFERVDLCLRIFDRLTIAVESIAESWRAESQLLAGADGELPPTPVLLREVPMQQVPRPEQIDGTFSLSPDQYSAAVAFRHLPEVEQLKRLGRALQIAPPELQPGVPLEELGGNERTRLVRRLISTGLLGQDG